MLYPLSEPFFRQPSEESSRVSIEDMRPHGERMQTQLAIVKDDLRKVNTWLRKGATFVTGDTCVCRRDDVCMDCLSSNFSQRGQLRMERFINLAWRMCGRLIKSLEKYEVVVWDYSSQ
ncbi:hypothetical protein ARMGADRAFT_193915 [Armillaria gallica]|uniref:Glutathione S-transferase UstS-like C-terminal domain-containing protein n=1 Tax=Armillaria gallica TaxID=47427 RepID=A0A2H3DUJ9_ARMGA|nr:hypothetical protein ARMGADRAFT_193915 [Armillaria gallica]